MLFTPLYNKLECFVQSSNIRCLWVMPAAERHLPTDEKLSYLIRYLCLELRCINGTARFKNVNSCLNTNIYSHLKTSGAQSSNPYLNVAHFFNTGVN